MRFVRPRIRTLLVAVASGVTGRATSSYIANLDEHPYRAAPVTVVWNSGEVFETATVIGLGIHVAIVVVLVFFPHMATRRRAVVIAIVPPPARRADTPIARSGSIPRYRGMSRARKLRVVWRNASDRTTRRFLSAGLAAGGRAGDDELWKGVSR